MRLPICDRAAAHLGLLLLVWSAASSVSAGIVAPPLSASPVADRADLIVPHTAGPMAAPPSLTSSDRPAFWFPGVDDQKLAQVSLNAVTVRAMAAEAAEPRIAGAQEHPLIPLPPSAWTGMAGLLGLGAVKVLRNARKWLA